MLYWRIIHFYFIHRGMHPWWNRSYGLQQGDIGAFLYRYVHAHHHKSYNPTAFSGISMLPVESILYLSAALIPLLFRSGCHPWIHLYTKLDLSLRRKFVRHLTPMTSMVTTSSMQPSCDTSLLK